MMDRRELAGSRRSWDLRWPAALAFAGWLLAVSWFGGAALAMPPFLALQVVFRQFMYPLLTGERAVQAFPHAFAVYFALVVVSVVALVVGFYRRLARTLVPESYIGRAAKVFGLMVLVTYVLNWQIQGGLGIPLALGYAGILLILTWEAQRVVWLRRILVAIVWAGMGFLTVSGGIISLAAEPLRFELQRLHGVYGFLWMGLLGAYLIEHITFYEGKRETSLRNWGYLAAVLLAAAVLTGVARLHGGGATTASGLWPHVIVAVFGLGVVGIHVGRSWRKRGLESEPSEARGSGRYILASALLGAAAVLVPMFSGAHEAGSASLRAPCGEEHLANPTSGVTASGVDRTCLSVSELTTHPPNGGCGTNGGCHVDIQAQWERSAHRFSANPAYRQAVGLMIDEEGIEEARLCAGCHDPVALLSGQLVAGSGYPFETSEGVTCVVCHSMRPNHGSQNGVYTVEPSALFQGSVRDAFTAYMMVELYRDRHDRDHLAPSLVENRMCAACHNLSNEHVVLRRTFDEWSEGPYGAGKPQARRCTECHMPAVGRSYLTFELHDHRMPGANIALAPLRGESTDIERDFIAASLNLDVRVAGDATTDALRLQTRLENRGGAHVFPTAPRDLVEYWFEARFEPPGEEPAWHRLGSAGLFDEDLFSEQGALLTRHEIWRAARREGAEGLHPGEARQYEYALPAPSAKANGVTVRLMHRRYREPFLKFLGPQNPDLYVAAVEILRKTTTLPLAPLTARQ